MASYKLIFRRSVAKDLRRVSNPDIARILSRIDALQSDPKPPGSEKLSGQERYRVRQDVYRILYEIADHVLIVTVVKIGHRKQVYERR